MWTALLWLLLWLPSPLPDVLLPGSKSVTHELILEWNAEDVGVGHRFVAYPTRGFHGHHEIEAGKPFTFSSKYGTRIYVVPLASEFPTVRDRAIEVEWISDDVPVRQIAAIAVGNPLARVMTTFRIVGVTADGIEFERVSEQRFDSGGRELGSFDWLPLVLIAGAGAVLLLVLSRRARSGTEAASR